MHVYFQPPEVGSKPKYVKEIEKEKKKAKVGNNNGQLRIANGTSCGARKAAWDKRAFETIFILTYSTLVW